MDIKMADVFSDDVVADADSLIASGYGVLADFSGYKKECRYTSVAINSYDDNQALIAKQAEQLNIMRHALTEIKNTPSVRHDECSWMASVALEATKDQA